MTSERSPVREPMRLVFGVHLHQPVGNFDEVFALHARDVYRPLVEQLTRRKLGPALLHVSGPLLEWLDANDTALLDDVGRLVADGRIELLVAGMYEPILAAIPRADRVEQIARHRDALRARFGAATDGLWLTERVWEPELAADLADAGVQYVLVDDRHFLVSGFGREELHAPFRTESDGRGLTVLAIDERLRYMIPFAPPDEIARYLRATHEAGAALLVYADDGEKFGGWPGTRRHVYDDGWFDRFCDMLDAAREDGTIRLCGGLEATRSVSSRGLVYLPTAAYQEMEGWSLPPRAARRLTALVRDLGAERMAGPDRALVRGAHWRNFLVRYAEANRLHKKMIALSGLSRRRGDPVDARDALSKAQCNDAYWHGVFGGLYLPHLRAAVWKELAHAERALRAHEPIGAESLDIDYDGFDEIWVHSAEFSAIVAPGRGGAIIEFTRFASGMNYADVLTRRLEAYHLPPIAGAHADDASRVESIHDREAALGLATLPPLDLDDRGIGVARVLPAGLSDDVYAAAAYVPIASWARVRCASAVRVEHDRATVRCHAPGFSVQWAFTAAGHVGGTYEWDANAFTDGERFAAELSLASPLEVYAPDAVSTVRYAVETVAKSERGVERVTQGESVTPLFSARSGRAHIAIA